LTGAFAEAIFSTGKQLGSVRVPQPPESATQLLLRWREGDREALRSLIPLVYKELRQAAHRCLRSERSGHTLESTALVHEVYMRLAGSHPPAIENRAHFVAIAAKLMRQILVDYARKRGAAKRGPDYKVELHEGLYLPQNQSVDIVALDHALDRLSQRDEQQEKIVELRFFGGLTVEETAQVLEISPATVKRDWSMAKAWLTREVGRSIRGEDRPVGAGEGTV
jgi:RNA polymerase sigma factor (TIGR02999 family)